MSVCRARSLTHNSKCAFNPELARGLLTQRLNFFTIPIRTEGRQRFVVRLRPCWCGALLAVFQSPESLPTSQIIPPLKQMLCCDQGHLLSGCCLAAITVPQNILYKKKTVMMIWHCNAKPRYRKEVSGRFEEDLQLKSETGFRGFRSHTHPFTHKQKHKDSLCLSVLPKSESKLEF